MTTWTPTLDGAPRERPGADRWAGRPREAAEGTVCLGLAVAAGGAIWCALGSALAFLLH